MDNETKKFLSDVGGDEQIKDEPVIPEIKEEKEIPEEFKNRQIKRLLKRREEERQSAIELSEKVRKANEEIEYLKRDKGGTLKYSDRLERIIGNDTKEKQALVEEMAKILEENEEGAVKRAKESFENARKQESERIKAEQTRLDSFVEDSVADVEETFGIDLTSDTKEANDRYDRFMALVKKMSPKDSEGNISSYADFGAVAEIFKERESKGSSLNRKKEISARGASQAAPIDANKSDLSAQEAWLKRNGILPKDFKKFG